MATQAAVFAHAAFALGYAEDGEFPVAERTKAACLAVQEAAVELDSPDLTPLIIEAGRQEGRRSSRVAKHRALYDYHSSLLGDALAAILAKLDTDDLAPKLAALAAKQTESGADPVTRRQVVSAAALAAITAHVTDTDRNDIDALNQDGWTHATAYGTGEAIATPSGGGAPNPNLIAGAAAGVLSSISSDEAQAAVADWTDLQLQTIAMGAALAAGDGKALADSTRALKTALVTTGRATRTYADQLHSAVTQAYIAQTQLANPGVLYDWVTADDPCDDCEDNADESPYEADDVPDYPEHPNCLCDIEAVAAVLDNA